MKRNRQMALTLGAMGQPANRAERFPQLLVELSTKTVEKPVENCAVVL
jgi:hypothetical protein